MRAKAFKTVIVRFFSIAAILMLTLEFIGAEEFLIFDKTISWGTNATMAFYLFMPGSNAPADWVTPNDYYHGSIYTRYEVISAATNISCGMQFDMFQYQPSTIKRDSTGELCEPVRWLNGVGSVVTSSSTPSTWWRTKGGVDFHRISDIKTLSMTIWSSDPQAPIGKAGEGGDAAGLAWARRFNWFPITLRVTVVAVSQGSTFSGWQKYVPDPSTQKPTPTYGIDYINETTDKVVPTTDEFSSFPTMYGAVNGSGQKMTMLPGMDSYFRTKAGNGLLQSEIQHFDIPCRPATPTFALDNINHSTTTAVSSAYEYSDFADMSDAVTGNGNSVSIPAGTIKYIRKKATVSSFKSNVQALGEFTRSAIAHEMLLFNDIINFPNSTDTNGFYYFYYNADMPVNWKSPDDYYNGQIYVRYELISEKTSTQVGLQIGIWQLLPPETGEIFETMSDIATLNGPGSIVTMNSSPSSWWKLNGGVDYTQMDLTWHFGINPWKMPDNKQIRQENASVWAERNTYWFPMKVYVTIVAVASGHSFSGWNNYLGVKPLLPSYTLNYQTEKTSQAIPATDEYSNSISMSPAYSGTGSAIDVTPGQNLYFRTKSQGLNPVSDIQRLVVPARSAGPSYSVNYSAETTNESVSTSDEYSANNGMTGAITGINNKVAVTPGNDLYFRSKASSNAFVSNISHLVVPMRPQPPVFTIDYENTSTAEAADTDIAYSIYANLSDPSYGSGTIISLVPGNDLYFKQLAGNSSFSTGISHLTVPGNNFLGYSGNDTITEDKFMLYAIMLDESMTFSLDDIQVANGTAKNLRSGNVFDVYPESKGYVSVIIPANTVANNTFASNEVVVYNNKTVTGISELNSKKINLYPNPSQDGIIQIETELKEPYTIRVFASDGHFIRNIEMAGMNTQVIDLHDLLSGIYFLKIITGGNTSVQKLIIQ
jgi:hypothetical protein